jgi:hypothetical protein
MAKVKKPTVTKPRATKPAKPRNPGTTLYGKRMRKPLR